MAYSLDDEERDCRVSKKREQESGPDTANRERERQDNRVAPREEPQLPTRRNGGFLDSHRLGEAARRARSD